MAPRGRRAAFAQVPDVALTCAFKVAGEPGLWGCGQAGGAGQFFSSTDGTTWTPLVGFVLDERACPAGSDGAVCPLYLPDAGVGPVEDDAGAEPDDAGAHADAGGAGDDDAGRIDGDDDAGVAADGGDGAGDPICDCAATRGAPGGAALALLGALVVALRRRASS